MKIIAIVGSPNNDKSNTVALLSDLLDSIRSTNSKIETEIISLGKMK
jgi:multimeric flavodoxin WrbA